MQLTDLQEQWLQALESGEYSQATRALEYSDGYCCLGVGCVIAEKNGIEVLKDGIYFAGTSLTWYQQKTRVALKLKTGFGDPIGNDFLKSLIHYNDELQWDFKQIAAHIRKYAEYYLEQESDNG